jgi:hypothetical protein
VEVDYIAIVSGLLTASIFKAKNDYPKAFAGTYRICPQFLLNDSQ